MKSISKLNTLVCAAILPCMVACLTLGALPVQAAPDPQPVSITAVFDFSTFPDLVGVFTTTGALNLSGVATMDIGPNANGEIAHCVVTLYPADGSGTITIHQECQFATSPPLGQWEVVSGTGAYADLIANGGLTMPPNTEAMTGFVY